MCLSALDHEPDATLIILLVDEKRNVSLHDERIQIVWAEDLDFPDYLKCAFKYNIIELNTALKPFTTLRLLETFSRVIYLDPDVCVYAPLSPVHEALADHSAVLTPHALSPYIGNGRPADQDLLRFGAFNLGFFAFKADNRSRALLRWWDGQCRSNCFYEPQIGLGVDQKWMDLASSFFEGVHILRDLGLNVAFWNLHERKLSKINDIWHVNDHIPLRFIHFSSFITDDHSSIAAKQTRYEPGSRPDFASAAQTYRAYLEKSTSLAALGHLDYGYSHFKNGAPISATLRRFYAISKHPAITSVEDPFNSESVHEYAKVNGLLTQDKATASPTLFKAQSGYSKQQTVIRLVFRGVLKVIGPDKYFLLLRYLANYSSIFNQADIGESFDSRYPR